MNRAGSPAHDQKRHAHGQTGQPEQAPGTESATDAFGGEGPGRGHSSKQGFQSEGCVLPRSLRPEDLASARRNVITGLQQPTGAVTWHDAL